MKTWARLAATSILVACVATAAAAQPAPPTPLRAGMALERTLAARDEHVYTVALASGAALIGQADQHGIDVVIDVFGPDGALVVRLDSPNGADGPEPIEIMAAQGGTYRFVVHSLDPRAPAGTYVMNVGRILTPAENARHVAETTYPAPLFALWEASRTDPRAVDAFIAGRKGRSALLDVAPGGAGLSRVTYVMAGDADTERMIVNAGPDAGVVMRRFARTNLFFETQIVPDDSRFTYSVIAHEVHRAGPKGEVETVEDVPRGRWLLELPNAPPQPYLVAGGNTPRGKLAPASIDSTSLHEKRTLTVYTPPGYDGTVPATLLVVFDGSVYGGGPPEQTLVPTPAILDNLIAQKKIGPAVAVFVWSMGLRNRDLTGSKPFADFVAGEVVPWARAHYRIAPGPQSVVTAGSSFGGFAATYCAFTHPDAIGNVISQSGSYWLTKDRKDPTPYSRETGAMIDAFRESARLPIRFYMEIGRYESGTSMVGSNRELRDVLRTKGYDVDYHEYDGGHDYASWRGSLADGLISLLGAKRS